MQKATETLAAQCRAEIERRLAVCEAAKAGAWECDIEIEPSRVWIGGESRVWIGDEWVTVENPQNAAFIAASRNERPAELRALLDLLDWVDAHTPCGDGLVYQNIATALGILEASE